MTPEPVPLMENAKSLLAVEIERIWNFFAFG